MTTTWTPCRACGATTRHDDGICIRDPRHPRFDTRTPSALRGPTVTVALDHPGARREADIVRETYRDDPTVSNEEFGQMVEDADRADQAREDEAELRCLQEGPDCEGAVEYRLAPDRDDMKAFPRCEHHWQKRLASAERNRELLSDVPPAWFDPSYAGESWGED